MENLSAMEADDKEAAPDVERGILGLEPEAAASPAPTAQTRSTAFLDGLRGLAALMVYMSHHMVRMYGTDDPVDQGFGYQGKYPLVALPFLRVFFTGGSPAVAFFFVLSGYVLSRSPLGMLRAADPAPLRTRLVYAAIRRPFRLFLPVAAVSLAMALCLHLPFGLGPLLGWPAPRDNLLAELWSWLGHLAYALNPFVKHGIAEPWFPYDPPIWTIAIEYTGSMLIFALIALLPVVPARWRGLSLILLSLAFLFVYQWAMACFVAGLVLAMSDVEGSGDVPKLARLSNRARMVLYNGLFFAGWYLLGQPTKLGHIEASLETPGWGWLTPMIPPAYYKGEYWRFWNFVGGVMVVLSILRLRWLQHFFTLPPLRYLGRVSFSLYLVHIPLLWVVGDRIYRLFGSISEPATVESWFDNRLRVQDLGPHGISTRFIVIQLFMLPLTLLLAEWGTVLLDQPSVKVGKWIEARLKGKS